MARRRNWVGVVLVVLTAVFVWSGRGGREVRRVPASIDVDTVRAAQGSPAGPVPPPQFAVAVPVAEVSQQMGPLFRILVRSPLGPVREADVTLFRRTGVVAATGEVLWQKGAQAKTDGGGSVELPAQPGTWFSIVRASGWAVQHVDLVKPSGELVTSVTVDLEAGYRLQGRARDTSGGVVVPAVIHAIPLGSREANRPTAPDGVRTVDADLSGTFVLSGLSAGRWRLEGEAEGSGRAGPVEVSLPQVGELQLTFVATGFLDGVVLLPDGGAAAGAELLLSGRSRTQTLQVGPTGTFSSEVAAGSYQVSAALGGLVGHVQGPVVVHGATTKSVRVPLTGHGGTIEGVVRDDLGAPITGASVVVSPHNESGLCARALTDVGGVFRLEGIAPGIYDVDASELRFAPASRAGFAVEDSTVVSVELALRRLGRIHGTARDGTSPAEGVTVTLGSGELSPRLAKTDSRGEFEFEGVPPGRARLVAARLADEHPIPTPVDVHAGQTSEVVIALQHSMPLRVVVDRSKCGQKTALRMTFVKRETEGAAAFIDVPAEQDEVPVKLSSGSWVVFVNTDDHRCGVSVAGAAVEIGETEAPSPLTVHLADQKSLKVAVLDAEGQPAPASQITVLRPGSTWTVTAGQNGEGVVPRMTNGPLSVSASWHGQHAAIADVPEDTREVTLSVREGASAAVRLNGFSGPTTLRVEAASASGSYSDAVVASSSELRLDGLPVGTVVVRAYNSAGALLGEATFSTRAGEQSQVDLSLVAPRPLR